MSKPKNRKIIAGVVIVLSALFYLGFMGYEESKAYYRTVEEIQTLSDADTHLRFKVGGDVEEGSIIWVESGVDFTLVQNESSLTVAYRGKDPVPDTFRDGSEAIVEGTIRPDGTFEAVKIQAKCASKYEAEYDYETHSAGTPEGGESY